MDCHAVRRSDLIGELLSTFFVRPRRNVLGWRRDHRTGSATAASFFSPSGTSHLSSFLFPAFSRSLTPMQQIRHLALLALGACSLGTEPTVPEGALKVLFIGNSLTYTNNLPSTIAQLAQSAGAQECYCYSISYPNFALEDHYDFREAVTALSDESWDFVVMQQGPSALSSSKEQLITWASVFDELIDENGATPIMYGVWPQGDRMFDFPNVADSYRSAAIAINGLFAPAGEAWQKAWAQDSTLPLYGPDFFHPSTMGTYLAALTVFQRIYNRSPNGIQATAVVAGRAQPWPVTLVQLLQSAAADANAAEDARTAGSTVSVRRSQ
jgi:hypothetical protein